MTLDEIMQRLSIEARLKPAQVKKVLDGLVEGIKTSVANGDTVHIPGLGSFEPYEQKAEERVNAETGERVSVPSAKFPIFRPARALTGRPKRQRTDSAA